MNRWPWLVEQPCHLPHKWHFEGRRDDVSKNLGNWNYRGIPTGNPWTPVMATPWPTETVLSRFSRPLSRESPCLVVVNGEELSPARVVALARLGWSDYSEPTSFPSLHGEIAGRPYGKGLRSSGKEGITILLFIVWSKYQPQWLYYKLECDSRGMNWNHGLLEPLTCSGVPKLQPGIPTMLSLPPEQWVWFQRFEERRIGFNLLEWWSHIWMIIPKSHPTLHTFIQSDDLVTMFNDVRGLLTISSTKIIE